MKKPATIAFLFFILFLTKCKVKNSLQKTTNNISYLNILCGDSRKYWNRGNYIGSIYCKQGYFIEFVYDNDGKRNVMSRGPDILEDTIEFTLQRDTLVDGLGAKWLIVKAIEDTIIFKNLIQNDEWKDTLI